MRSNSWAMTRIIRARRRTEDAAEGFHGRGKGAGVADDAVAGDRLGQPQEKRRLVAPTQEEILHAAVLEAELDLEVVDVLALAGEAEMAGLDDPGVNRADADFVHLVALHSEESGGRLAGIDSGDAAADRLQPGMADRLEAELLVDFPLEQMEGRDVGRDRRITCFASADRSRRRTVATDRHRPGRR